MTEQTPAMQKPVPRDELKFSPRFAPGGDRALYVYLGDRIDEKTNNLVRALFDTLNAAGDPAFLEAVPAYASLLVHFRPERKSYREMCEYITSLCQRLPHQTENHQHRTLIVPVCYGARFGPDLTGMEQVTGLDRDEIIRRHCSRDYRIYMMGFLPGFCYLGGLDERIHTPRLSSPRLRIPAGSVGIGGSQTGIYPMDSPGGWQLMGMTPVKTYDPQREVPILVQAGEYIRFVRIDEDEFRAISEQVAAGTYQVVIREGEA